MKRIIQISLLAFTAMAFAWAAEARTPGYLAASQYFTASNSGTEMSARYQGKKAKKKKATRNVASEKSKKAKKHKSKKKRH